MKNVVNVTYIFAHTIGEFNSQKRAELRNLKACKIVAINDVVDRNAETLATYYRCWIYYREGK